MAKPISPKGRVSFPSVFEPNEFGGNPKYEITLLFDKNDPDLKTLRDAAAAVVKEKWKDKVPKDMHNPFKDGDEIAAEKGRPEYAGKIAVKFSCGTNSRPEVVDRQLNRIDKASGELYAGCWARVSYSCFAFEHKLGKKGVSFALGNVIKVEDADAFDGRSRASDDFAAVADTQSVEDLF
jgi:hypothetical protein